MRKRMKIMMRKKARAKKTITLMIVESVDLHESKPLNQRREKQDPLMTIGKP